MDRNIIAHDITIKLLENGITANEAVNKYFELLPTVRKAVDEHLDNQPLPKVEVVKRPF